MFKWIFGAEFVGCLGAGILISTASGIIAGIGAFLLFMGIALTCTFTAMSID